MIEQVIEQVIEQAVRQGLRTTRGRVSPGVNSPGLHLPRWPDSDEGREVLATIDSLRGVAEDAHHDSIQVAVRIRETP